MSQTQTRSSALKSSRKLLSSNSYSFAFPKPRSIVHVAAVTLSSLACRVSE